MKKIILILSLFYCVYLQAQPIVPAQLKDSAVKGYIKLMASVEDHTYQASTDPYFVIRSKCLSYCHTQKDSVYFINWVVKKYNEYKRDIMSRP